MWKTICFVVIFTLSISIPALAQVDTEFWFAAPEVTVDHADRPVYLRISSLQAGGSITISQPANPSFAAITQSIGANSTLSIDLTEQIDQIENMPADQVLNFGLFIKSTNPITVYYEVFGTNYFAPGANSDLFVLKGSHALGKEFYTPFQTHWNNNTTMLNDAWSSFDIVATENNTGVTITPSKNIVGHAAGVPYTIFLQKGQTYSARAVSPLAAEHPSGSHITSTKPIAVTVKDDSMQSAGNYDLGGDQIIPLDFIGKEYIAIKVSDVLNTDRLYVVVTKPNTTISLNGTSMTTINAGQTYEIHLLTPTGYITASDSVYVYHVAGFAQELGGAILPPLGCTGSRQVSFTRSTNELFYIQLVVKSGYEQYFTLNGSSTLVPAGVFNTVPFTGGVWKYARIPFNATTLAAGSANLLKNDSADFQLSTLNGGSTTGFRYGYFSDFGFLELGSDKGICEGDSTKLLAGPFMDSYLWNTGSTDFYLTAKDSGRYSITVTKGTCQIRDSIKIFFLPKITSAILGNDTAGCSNSRLTIKTLSSFASYVWNTGSTDANLRPVVSGEYTVTVTNSDGCKNSDTISVLLYPAPNPQILYDTNLEPFCKNPLAELRANEDFAQYLWSTGDTTKTIATPHTETDFFTLYATNSYGCSRYTEISIDCSPVIGLVPNLLTPNGDGKNDIFYIEHLRHGKWIFEVYNRWGERVYAHTGYDNSFDPEALNDGIYYFSLRHKEGKGEKKGWVQVIR